MADKKIQWHPGFAAAVNLELSANRGDLIYEREYNLNTKPLAVDLLVIKKDKGVDLENEIGKLFRGHNILEYKSPDDSLSIDTFYKSAAYACLYKAYGEAVDSRQASEITVTMVRGRKPAYSSILTPMGYGWRNRTREFIMCWIPCCSPPR